MRKLHHKRLLLLLLPILLFAQTFALMHRVAHAHAQQTVHVVAVAESANAVQSFLLFGHAAGSLCDAWDAAFGIDSNPDAGYISTLSIIKVASVYITFLHSFPAWHPLGLASARAPPRI